MFIDDIKNRYTYLNTLKNVVLEESLSALDWEGREVILHPGMQPVLDRLFKERPTWRFKSTQNFFGSATAKVTDLAIYDGDEKLGRLWIEHHWRDGSTRYNFDNFRLSRARQRSGVSYTTKPDVAVKRIVKAFHLKTPKERATEAFGEVRKAVSQVTNGANWPMHRARNVIEQKLFDYAADHWDQVKPFLGEKAAELDFPALVEAAREARDMGMAFEQREGVMVRIEANSSYLVARSDNNAFDIKTYNETTLPDHLRGALGLLKLVNDGGFIANIGVRVKVNLYFVMDKKGE